jgi:hypothetical protein
MSNTKKDRELVQTTSVDDAGAASIASVRELMSGLIDYAGLFPPARLGMREAVQSYFHYRQSVQSWMLGRFIVPATRMEEFAKARSRFDGGEWRVSVLASASSWDDFRAIEQWNASRNRLFTVDSYEVKVAGTEEIVAIADLAPTELATYFEFSPAKLEEFLPAVSDAGGSAKIRTGGMEADMFPSPALVANFIYRCALARICFKATAGLHHAMRAAYPITYEPDSPTALMHGFLNVFLAGAFAWSGASREELESLLEERNAVAFAFSDAGVRWRDRIVSIEDIGRSREQLAGAFGSCSFEEPIRDLQELKLV